LLNAAQKKKELFSSGPIAVLFGCWGSGTSPHYKQIIMKKKNKSGKKQHQDRHPAKIPNSGVKNSPIAPHPCPAKELEEAVFGAAMLEKSTFDPVMNSIPRQRNEIIYVSWWKARFLVINGSRHSLLVLAIILLFLLVVLVMVALIWHQ
jgi:hypothetical protein